MRKLRHSDFGTDVVEDTVNTGSMVFSLHDKNAHMFKDKTLTITVRKSLYFHCHQLHLHIALFLLYIHNAIIVVEGIFLSTI